ncbi:MAG: hypothetical protein JWR00_942, partial [Rubritepida sp.]|nr:hypothetical protein [Rubritepida sp.]
MTNPPHDGPPPSRAGRAIRRRQDGKSARKSASTSAAPSGDDVAAGSRPARPDLSITFGPAVALAWEMLDEAMRASPEFLPAATAPGAVVILDVPDGAWGEEIAIAWRRLTDGAAPEVTNAKERRVTEVFGEEDEGKTSPGRKSDPVEIQAFKTDAPTRREQLGA